MVQENETLQSTGDRENEERYSEHLVALLMEIKDMLARLVESGEHNYVDVLDLDFPADDIQQLKQALGSGAVQATVDELGLIQIYETSVPGVWWVTHKSVDDEILSEVIEVTTLPEILVTQHQDLHESIDVMQERLERLNLYE